MPDPTTDTLREALIGGDPLDPRWTWLAGAAERLREHAPADEDPHATYEAAEVLDLLYKSIREALAAAPAEAEYEWRAVEADGAFSTIVSDTTSSYEFAAEAARTAGGWIERRRKSGPWEWVSDE